MMRDIMVSRSRNLRTHLVAALMGLAGIAAATPAAATIDPSHQFVVNGGFEQTTNGAGELGYNTAAVGWTSSPASNGDYGYNFIFNPATASTTGAGAPNQYGENMTLWGPNNGSNNGLGASPTGGNFLAADGAYNNGVVSQQITGLIVGQTYSLSFNWAGAQQSGYTGATTEAWYYGLYNEGFNNETAVINNASHGFTGWHNDTMAFVATSSSEVLSFLAVGTPNGKPPFALLDGVSLDTPEPSAFVAMFAGVIGLGVFARRRSRTKRSAK